MYDIYQIKLYNPNDYFDLIVECNNSCYLTLMRILFDLNVAAELRNVVFQYFGQYAFAEHTIVHNILEYYKFNHPLFLKIIAKEIIVYISHGKYYSKKINIFYTIPLCRFLLYEKYEQKLEEWKKELDECKKLIL